MFELYRLWSQAVVVAEVAWRLLVGMSSTAWDAIASIHVDVFGVVFVGAIVAVALGGDELLISAHKQRKRGHSPRYSPVERFALYLSVVVLLTAGGYVLYHALLIGSMLVLGFLWAWFIRHWWRARHSNDDEELEWRRR